MPGRPANFLAAKRHKGPQKEKQTSESFREFSCLFVATEFFDRRYAPPCIIAKT
jgi:hypothetical protein